MKDHLKVRLQSLYEKMFDLKRASSLLQVDRRLDQPAEHIFLCPLGRTPACVETKVNIQGHYIFSLFCCNRKPLISHNFKSGKVEP